jgi:hypothetical protein
LCLKLIYIYIVDQNTYYNVCQSGLEICSTIRVRHIEFGKFGLNVAVLCSTSDRAKKVSPDSNVARSIMANGIAIFGIIAN